MVSQIIIYQALLNKGLKYLIDGVIIILRYIYNWICIKKKKIEDSKIELKRPPYEYIYSISRNLNMFNLVMTLMPFMPLISIFGLIYYLIDLPAEHWRVLYLFRDGRQSGKKAIEFIPFILFFYFLSCITIHSLFLYRFFSAPWVFILYFSVAAIILLLFLLLFFFGFVKRLILSCRKKHHLPFNIFISNDQSITYKQNYYDEYINK